MTNFHVGQKVVCVNAGSLGPHDSGLSWYDGCAVYEGSIYTVRAVGVNSLTGQPGIKLQERLLCGHWAGEFFRDEFYNARRFRPVIERKTDISIFTEMLTPSEIEKAKKELV